MKKFVSFCFLVLILTFSIFGASCNSEDLTQNIVELRQNVYAGDYNGTPLRASYGYKKSDGAKNYSLSFILPFNQVSSTTCVKLNFNEQEYMATFALSEFSGNYLAKINVEDFSINEFDCTLIVGNEHTNVKMVSEVPSNACDYKKAVEYLQQNQPELLDLYRDNGVFSANLTVRVIGKNDKCYYYIGIEKKGNIKALLIDGFSGEVLAVRDIR